MANFQPHYELSAAVPGALLVPSQSHWYALHTTARHEKRVADRLEERKICTFAPVVPQRRQWSDRRAVVDVPLFSCYVFVRTAPTSAERFTILGTPGVLGFVGSARMGTPIPADQICGIQVAVREKLLLTVHPYTSAGKRVRIRGGALDGVEGILIGPSGDSSLLISVELLQRSVAVCVRGYDVELVR